MFRRGQEAIGNKSYADIRQMEDRTRNRYGKDFQVNRLRMLVIANSLCLELLVWSTIDETGMIYLI